MRGMAPTPRPTVVTCPDCGVRWTCWCNVTPCLFEGARCDPCQLDALYAADERAKRGLLERLRIRRSKARA